MLIMPSENGERAEALTPDEAFVRELREHFEVESLEPWAVYEIPLLKSDRQVMASCSDPINGLSQKLRAVVKAGDELFFIIDAVTRLSRHGLRRPDYVESTLLARYEPDDGSAIIDFSREPRRLDAWDGTKHLNICLSGATTRFTVAQSDDKLVGVVDEGSSAKLEVFTQKTPDNPDDTPITLGPVDERIWSVTSFDLMKTIRESLELR
ncbi:MAG TPA: hypothetical protein VMR16_00045 [Candidatus Saccharimonadales bacterium]|nr:hypothetical protein [Candidatus Saccharimonadales bacterium]